MTSAGPGRRRSTGGARSRRSTGYCTCFHCCLPASASARAREVEQRSVRRSRERRVVPEGECPRQHRLRVHVRLALRGIELAVLQDPLHRDPPAAIRRRVEPARVVPAGDVRWIEELLPGERPDPGPVGRGDPRTDPRGAGPRRGRPGASPCAARCGGRGAAGSPGAPVAHGGRRDTAPPARPASRGPGRPARSSSRACGRRTTGATDARHTAGTRSSSRSVPTSGRPPSSRHRARAGRNGSCSRPSPRFQSFRKPVSDRACSRTSRSVYAPRSAPSVKSSIISRA